MAYTGVMLARADMCEILAMKLLSRFSSSKIQLASVLMTSWDPLAGAPQRVFEEIKELLGGDDDDMNNPQCALEVSLFLPLRHPLGTALRRLIYSCVYPRTLDGDRDASQTLCRRAPRSDRSERRVFGKYRLLKRGYIPFRARG